MSTQTHWLVCISLERSRRIWWNLNSPTCLGVRSDNRFPSAICLGFSCFTVAGRAASSAKQTLSGFMVTRAAQQGSNFTVEKASTLACSDSKCGQSQVYTWINALMGSNVIMVLKSMLALSYAPSGSLRNCFPFLNCWNHNWNQFQQLRLTSRTRP